MTLYRVQWEMDIEAPTPLEAAHRASRINRTNDKFIVRDPGTHELTTVDMEVENICERADAVTPREVLQGIMGTDALPPILLRGTARAEAAALLARAEAAIYKAVRCDCGRAGCKDWHVTNVADVGGVQVRRDPGARHRRHPQPIA